MRLFWVLLLIAVAIIGFFVVAARRKREARRKVEKYVCSVCHGTDCDCRRIE